MNEIQILDNTMINQIAAGEVVERPLSIVKELVENAIDAGASSITVEIVDGGISSIRVVDNGGGIPAGQVERAFMRHATSKITDMEDLIQVMSLGFRGEALSSIASVAQVEITTKTTEAAAGIRLSIEGGVVTGRQEIGCQNGTTVITRNLFYNTPVRLKFLKRAATEAGYISEIMQKIALGHPEIAFKYLNGKQVVLQTNGKNDLQTAIFYVYGKAVTQKLIPLEYDEEPICLSGFIGRPEIARGNRGYQNMFINGRYVKSTVLQSAVEDAYKTLMTVGKFPVYVLNLFVPPDYVDVNVHPTKLEVRFREEEKVYGIVMKAVSAHLRGQSLIPEVKWESRSFTEIAHTKAYEAEKEQSKIYDLYEDRTLTSQKERMELVIREEYDPETKVESQNVRESGYKSTGIAQSVMDMLYKAAPSHDATDQDTPGQDQSVHDEANEAKATPVKRFFHHYEIIGQLFSTYWIVEQEKSMYLIDQHAAHERALYEELINKIKTEVVDSQPLLQPFTLRLSELERQTVNDNLLLLESFGFEIEDFGMDTIAIRAVPYVLQTPAKPEFFIEILDSLQKIDGGVSHLYELKLDAIAMISCKAAVKAHDRLSAREARALIESVLALENPFTCPHGRPTIIEMTQVELEKKFKRIQ